MSGELGIGINSGENSTLTLNSDYLYWSYGQVATGTGNIGGLAVKFTDNVGADFFKLALYANDTDLEEVLAFTADVAMPTTFPSTVDVYFSVPEGITSAATYAIGIVADGYCEVASVSGGDTINMAHTFADPFPDNPTTTGYNGQGMLLYAIAPLAAGPVLTTPTPSGTIGTATTATIGFTSDTAGGSAVGIVDIPARTAGITAAQVKAGHNNLNAAPIAVLSSITPVVGANSFAGTTGLTANTGYSQAIVQTESSVDSNVLIGSFTTATATRSVTVGFNSDASTVLASTAMKFWTKDTKNGAAVDGGSGGLSGTTDASGNITLTGLTITAGAKYLQYMVGSDENNIHVIPVTYA